MAFVHPCRSLNVRLTVCTSFTPLYSTYCVASSLYSPPVPTDYQCTSSTRQEHRRATHVCHDLAAFQPRLAWEPTRKSIGMLIRRATRGHQVFATRDQPKIIILPSGLFGCVRIRRQLVTLKLTRSILQFQSAPCGTLMKARCVPFSRTAYNPTFGARTGAKYFPARLPAFHVPWSITPRKALTSARPSVQRLGMRT